MYVREATSNDIPATGEIQAICNRTDTLTRYFIKDMDKYPTTYRRNSVRFCKRRAAVPGAVVYVMETEASDYPPDQRHLAPEIVGFVIWMRTGESSTAKRWQARNSGFWANVNSALDGLEDRYLRTFTTVEGTFRAQLFRQVLPYLTIPFDQEIFAEAWEVDLFFVHPDWQRKGIGRKLLQWGFDQATKEKVPILVKSSSLGGVAYRSYGFRKLGEISMNALFDTTEFGGEEPAMWVWEPEECKDMWYERGKAALEKVMLERQEAH